MSKRSKDKDAAKEESADIKALNELGRKLMKVPKDELEKRLADEKEKHKT